MRREDEVLRVDIPQEKKMHTKRRGVFFVWRRQPAMVRKSCWNRPLFHVMRPCFCVLCGLPVGFGTHHRRQAVRRRSLGDNASR